MAARIRVEFAFWCGWRHGYEAGRKEWTQFTVREEQEEVERIRTPADALRFYIWTQLTRLGSARNVWREIYHAYRTIDPCLGERKIGRELRHAISAAEEWIVEQPELP
jgi:hypothetical protein